MATHYLVRCATSTLLFLSLAGAAISTSAQRLEISEEKYIQPPQAIINSVTAPWHENTNLRTIGPDGIQFLVERGDGMPSLDRMAAPHVTLAESKFEMEAYRSTRLTLRSNVGLDIFNSETGETIAVEIPEGARVTNASWSPNGDHVAFYAHFPEATHIYLADTKDGSSTQLTQGPVLATHVTSFQWSADGSKILTVLYPVNGNSRVTLGEKGVATEPKVRVSREGKTPSRTYRYLLESPRDMELLEYLSTGQAALISVPAADVTPIGQPGMIRSINSDTKGEYFRITYLKQPFSYYATLNQFGTKEVLCNAQGEELAVLNETELRDGSQQRPATPQTGARGARGGRGGESRNEGKRSITWRPDGKGISFLQLEPQKKEEASEDKPATADAGQTTPTDDAAGGKTGDGAAKPDDVKTDPTGDQTAQSPPTGGNNNGAAAPRTGGNQNAQGRARGRRGGGRRNGARSGQDGQEDDAEDGDQPRRKDRVMLWVAPFGETDVQVVYESEDAIQSAEYSADGKWLFVARTDAGLRTIHAIDLSNDNQAYQVFRGRATGGNDGGRGRRGRSADTSQLLDSYENFSEGWRQDPTTTDPVAAVDGGDAQDDAPQDQAEPEETQPGAKRGTLMTKNIAGEFRVVRVSSDGHVYFSGSDREEESEDPSPEAEPDGLAKAFIDKVNIETGSVEQIYEGTDELLETLVSVDSDDIKRVYTTREDRDQVPDYFVTDLASDEARSLTDNSNFTPWYNKLKIERFQVRRVDGFKFWVQVTRNPDYGQKLPAMFWFYPREYTDQQSYDQRAARGGRALTSRRFQRPSTRSMAILTHLGYAVIEPDLPIFGEQGRMNDNYVMDLRNGLWAVIDECDKRNIIDRDRLAIGGHSYGAFSTANALAHTPFFKAGIAGDGNYNRTLTPMSFQAERRYFWDARETYVGMSPLFWANQVNGALLMYHGMEDANTGTFPINSERMFQALDGLGKPAALYMYPYEAHGPAAKETILDMWARWVAWLDHYVKNPPPEEETPASSDGESVSEWHRR